MKEILKTTLIPILIAVFVSIMVIIPGTDIFAAQGHNQMRRPGPPLIAALDTDKDGIISADEINNAERILKDMDQNNDSILTLDEIHPKNNRNNDQNSHQPPPARQGNMQNASRRQPPKPPLFTLLDTDNNGSLSATEIENASATLQTIDTNGDGNLEPEEIRTYHMNHFQNQPPR